MQRLTELVHQKRSKHTDNPTSCVSRSFLWSWGNLSRKIPGKHKQRTPLLAESLDTERIASITCDARHIIVITRDGVIFLWELGKSLKKISAKRRYSNYKNRPESLHKLVIMMRNQLPIVSNFEMNLSNDIISNDISLTLNKRIFYGSDAVKWLMDHEAAFDEVESIRFCQSLLNEGRMESALINNNNIDPFFKNDKSGLYYFSDSKKKISSNYMQKFHAVPADPTLKFAVIASNQHYCYVITQNGTLYQWDLKQRSIDLTAKFIQKRQTNIDINDYQEDDDDEYDDDDDDDSMSDPLDSSQDKKDKAMSLNETAVQSFTSDFAAENENENENELIKNKLIIEQEHYAKDKSDLRETVLQIASKWIEPKEFFIGDNDDDDELPEMLLLEKLSCSPQLINIKQSMRNVSCGHDFVIVLSSQGQLFSWGNGYHGKLGIGNQNIYTKPQLIEYFTQHNIVINAIQCAFDHSLCITDKGKMYSFGSNRNGKLGIADLNINFVTIPHKIKILSNKYNTMYHRQYIPQILSKIDIIDPNKQTNDEAFNGMMMDQFTKQYIDVDDLFKDVVIVSISTGFGHNLAVVAGEGQVYSWGANLCGQLGLNDENDRCLPTLIQSLNKSVIQVGCGAFHSSALTIDGDVFCWGDNSEGQLGIGDINEEEEEITPKLVDYLSGVDTTSICCGADFTFAVSDNYLNYQNDYFHIKNEKELNRRKLHYKQSSSYNIPSKPQYRQCGLPLKTPSERRKHQKEIEKLQELFSRKEKSKKNNKFGAFIEQKPIERASKEKKRKMIVNLSDFSGKLMHKKSLNMEKGYTESDINRAVSFWCKTAICDFEKQKTSPKLRESVWKIGIPTRLRGRVWPLAIGNSLNINETLYQLFEKRAKQLIDNKSSQLGNESSIKYISVDLTRTFPSLSYFQDDGPLNETLHSLLQTYCFFRPDRGYIQGMSYLAANLLLYMDSYNAFVSFSNLLNQQFFHCILTLDYDIIKPRIDIFNNLFEYNLPQIFKLFEQNDISPKEYFLDWTISLFTKKLSISVASRVWDIILIFGEMEIYRCCVAILKCIYNNNNHNDYNRQNDNVRKKLKVIPSKLKEFQLITTMKTIKVPKKFKQKLQKLNQQHMR